MGNVGMSMHMLLAAEAGRATWVGRRGGGETKEDGGMGTAKVVLEWGTGDNDTVVVVVVVIAVADEDMSDALG
jgi:hypothetical protein